MKKSLILGLVLVLILCFASCGDDGNGDGMKSIGSNGAIQQYFGNPAYLQDSTNAEIAELNGPIEYTLQCDKNDNVYLAAVLSLKTLPEEGGKYCTMLNDSYTINNVTVNDGVAYVDFSSENLEGEAMTETILIDQIVYTLTNSFEEITAVIFTVDGESKDTLMGNVNISEAFVADYLDL